MIKMAPTDTTTLHNEHSHVDHIVADGLPVRRGDDRLTRLIVCLALLQSALSPSLCCTNCGSHATLLTPHQDLHRTVFKCVQ